LYVLAVGYLMKVFTSGRVFIFAQLGQKEKRFGETGKYPLRPSTSIDKI
jgi:hypothetical protein